MTIKQYWEVSLYYRPFLIFLLICNVLGTIYGYDWYSGQLYITPTYFLPFVPDSPTASLFLSIVIGLLLFNRSSSIIEALAFVTLVKYGVWAVIMNIIMFMIDGEITINGLMLLLSHGIMALQAFYFYPRFKITIIGFIVSFIWVLVNDYIDYVKMQFPYYKFIASHVVEIGVLSICLSIISLFLYLYLERIIKVKSFD
ncbi:MULTISPECIES: DUF1405 domain-containing protein [Staphylococcus]|uniref:DUF1405 domain-containing protein n=1 Tax=Staphylococcus TaxID=1279 RepID=UPI0002463DDA|nr:MULTISPECIES: DUF1405 domain-containing protein [Staphylococcus]MCR4455804.1 DUF1405 domain-containing protein [Aeromonas salmonicida]QAV31785.1 DUF1405 domain-containing protein [Sulfitobacter donghicola]AGZ24360.1 hypothetical protein STP1_0049 [Staphylococcus pasteuri SP1]KAB7645980.1 DUF1405 domain-containing protein [Staphylococcus sp. B2-b]MBN6852642.1 DUF1405 domain-containing protein [Staphylococcus warneri]